MYSNEQVGMMLSQIAGELWNLLNCNDDIVTDIQNLSCKIEKQANKILETDD